MKQILLLSFVIGMALASCSTPSFKPEQISLVPKPVQFALNEQSFEITSGTNIIVQNDNQNKAATYLKDMFKRAAGFELAISKENNSTGIIFENVEGLSSEAYNLEVNTKQIIIKASAEAGFFYGVQSIRQLLSDKIESKQTVQEKWYVPCVSIKDEPRFAWRGMHMDFSRHFFNIDEVKEFLDYMALYKLNTYHMHLTDDQGWRIEIKKYPLLTKKGAWREESSHDKVCKEQAKTNASFTIDESNYHQVDGKRMYGGFFTQDQIKEIVKYAADRCITVVPEIDMPGHFKSAIDNYPYLSCTGEPGWGKTFSTPACLGKESSYDFVEDILAEIADLFPGEYIHIGGDEVNTVSWTECEKCQKQIKKLHLKNEHELQSNFNQRIEKFLHAKGKRLMGWDEIVEGGLTKDASMMWWRNWAPKMRNIAADNGNDIVITPDFEYYFDFKNEATPVEKVYNYEPIPAEFTAAQAKHILGVQANVWSEWIPNFKRLQYQVFPRMLALAETGWTEKNAKDYNDFSQRLLHQYDRFDVMGIHYYIPSIEGLSNKIAFTDSAIVELTKPLEGLDIFYTLDGTEPTKKSLLYSAPFVVNKNGKIKVRAFRGDLGSEIVEADVQKQQYRKPVEVVPATKGLQRWMVEGKFKVVENVKLPSSPKWKTVDKANMGEYADKSQYSMIFKGFFNAESDGMYEFATKSDDGSLVYFGHKLIVDNGGNHSAIKRTGMIALKKGWHPLTIIFHQGGGGGELTVWYAKQGEPMKELNSDVCGF